MSLLEVKHMDYCYYIYEFELLSIKDCVRYPKNMNICISNHQTARVRRSFFATPSPTPTIRTHSERIIFMFFHQFYEGIKPLKMLTNKYLIHCIIFYWKRLLMQMMQRVTMCPVWGGGGGVSIIGVIVTNNIVTSYCGQCRAEARVTDHVCSMNASRCPGSMLL